VPPGALILSDFLTLKGRTLGARVSSAPRLPRAFWALSIRCNGIHWAEKKCELAPLMEHGRPVHIFEHEGPQFLLARC